MNHYTKANLADIFNSYVNNCKGMCTYIFNTLSLVTVVSLSVLTMYWWLEDSTVTTVQGSVPVITVKEGSIAEVQPLMIVTINPRISYDLLLLNSKKEIVAR